MERLELAISGIEQALRRSSAPAAALATTAPGAAAPTEVWAEPDWLAVTRRHLSTLMEALRAEDTATTDHALDARARRLARERNRLLRQLHQLAPALTDVRSARSVEGDQLRRRLLRLVHDVAHHHQRVNDLVYDAGWRDVGGSE